MLKRDGPLAARARKDLYDGPGLPDTLSYLWAWFMELDATRQYTQIGMSALSFTDVRNWADLTQRKPRPHEVDALMRLDILVRAASHPEKK